MVKSRPAVVELKLTAARLAPTRVSLTSTTVKVRPAVVEPELTVVRLALT
jgi:hypothetical protein